MSPHGREVCVRASALAGVCVCVDGWMVVCIPTKKKNKRERTRVTSSVKGLCRKRMKFLLESNGVRSLQYRRAVTLANYNT